MPRMSPRRSCTSAKLRIFATRARPRRRWCRTRATWQPEAPAVRIELLMSEPHSNLERLKSEGDLNLSPQRVAWSKANQSPATKQVLDEDARHFLHQSLSTPCLN